MTFEKLLKWHQRQPRDNQKVSVRPAVCLSLSLSLRPVSVYICYNYDNVSAPKWFTCLWQKLLTKLKRTALSCLPARLPACQAACCCCSTLRIRSVCVPSETFCRQKVRLAIMKTNKLCACCWSGAWCGWFGWLGALVCCVSSLIGQRQRVSSNLCK